MRIKLTKKIQNGFATAMRHYNKNCDADYNNKGRNPIVGHLWWNKPEEVLWLWATDNEEDYEGSQTQIGIKVDGTVVWGFFSHCSCFGYEDYEGDYKVFEADEKTYKQYEMEEVDRDVLDIIKERAREISKKL